VGIKMRSSRKQRILPPAIDNHPIPKFPGCDEPYYSIRLDEKMKPCRRRCEGYEDFIRIVVHTCERDIPFGKYIVEAYMEDRFGIRKVVYSRLVEVKDYEKEIPYIQRKVCDKISSLVMEVTLAVTDFMRDV
jgi:hypothetical protein